jgi:group I intron endonuclease
MYLDELNYKKFINELINLVKISNINEISKTNIIDILDDTIKFDGNRSKCIYGIKNIKTNQYYIGSTRKLNNRVKTHITRLERQEHHSPFLQKDWNDNKNNFEFILLERILNEKNILEREQWWIDNTDSFYNICKIAGTSLGVKRTEEYKKKISDSLMGVKHPPERCKQKSIYQTGRKHKKYSDEGRKNCSDAQKKLYMNGYIHPNKGKKHSEDRKKEIGVKSSKPIIQYDINDNFVKEWNSIKDATTNGGFCSSGIIDCLKNRKEKYKNFKWIYKKKERMV